jgi:hypothetical protein
MIGVPFGVSESDPQSGDIVIYRERTAQSGPCSVGVFSTHERPCTASPTYAAALREAVRLAAYGRVDVWTTFRVRWTDTAPQTFERLARHRPAPAP